MAVAIARPKLEGNVAVGDDRQIGFAEFGDPQGRPEVMRIDNRANIASCAAPTTRADPVIRACRPDTVDMWPKGGALWRRT
jgi:hypothetical protein